MSFYQRTWGRLWPGSAHVTPLCVILRPSILVFVCVLNAAFSGVLDERVMSCLQISALTTVSVCLFGGRETGLFLQPSQFFFLFFWFPFQTLNERGNVCFHRMKAFRHPRWVCRQRKINRVYGFNVQRLKIVTVTFCLFYVHTSASLFHSFSQVQIASRRMALLPRIAVILPFPSLNAASFFKYTLHHSSCHRACCHPTHTCCNWPHSLEMDGLQRETGPAILCTLIELKSNLTECTKKSSLPKGWQAGDLWGASAVVPQWTR